MAFFIAFQYDWCDRVGDDTGMIGAASGIQTPYNWRVRDRRLGTGSRGDCFKMFKTVGINRCKSHVVSLCYMQIAHRNRFVKISGVYRVRRN